MTSLCSALTGKTQIEFPSILLPASITSGSIVDITVSQNYDAERKSQAAFAGLQSHILNTYGLHSPSSPTLRLRGATQTSLVLEWDPIQSATSELKSLSLYRNGSKAGSIPRPKEIQSTKISGLEVDTEYSFHLVLRTTGGTYSSPTLTCRTHKMTDLSGITVTPGVLPEQLHASLESAVERIGGKIADSVRIDTTHLVCTEGRGKDWERAVEMSIPVVRPEWVEGCEREGRIVGVRGYYLDANPRHRQVGSNPQIASAAAESSTVAVGAKGSQTYLPERRVPPSTSASSPEKQSHMPGEGTAEQGEDVPPMPPPKTQAPSSLVSAEAASASPAAVSNAGEEEEEDDENPKEENEKEPSPVEENVPQNAGKRSEASMKAKVEDVEDGNGHGGMDDVSL